MVLAIKIPGDWLWFLNLWSKTFAKKYRQEGR